jgi:hypothetical protein
MSSSATLNGDATEITPHDHEKASASPKPLHGLTKDLFCLPIPQRLQFTSDKKIESGIWMNCGIGLAASLRLYLQNFTSGPS